MEGKKNKKKMTDKEILQLRNSPALFEFYRSLTALDIVLVKYVQKGRTSKATADETLNALEADKTSREIEARAVEAAEACQTLTRQFGGSCSPPSTWDPATETCN